jgi:gas vesicle structural protein
MQQSALTTTPRSSGLYDVLELILDKGLVIDAYVRVSLVGIELLTIDARIVIASVDTYLRFAEAVNRLDLAQSGNSQTLPEVLGDVTEKGAQGKSKGALSGAAEAISDAFSSGGDDDEDERPRRRSSSSREKQPARRSRES